MLELVSMDWVAQRLGQPEVVLVDARRPMKYLSGHLPGAINLPAYKAFDADGRLLAAEALAHWLGDAGLGDDSVAIIYDSPEGQNAAMLAWILEYLGHPHINLLEVFFERWKASGEVRYKPVTRPHETFNLRLKPAVRANLDEARAAHNVRFVDFRSGEEYSGSTTIGKDQPGHIPGALNVDWRDLGRPPELVLKPASELARIAAAAGIERGEQIVAYCRSGPRAALGYLALRQLGFDVRLFDGSFAQWSQAGLPVEK